MSSLSRSRSRSRSRNRPLPPEIKAGDKVIIRPDKRKRHSRALGLYRIPLDSILTVENTQGEVAKVNFGYDSFILPLESLEHAPRFVSTPPPSPHREKGGGRRRHTRRKRKGTRRH